MCDPVARWPKLTCGLFREKPGALGYSFAKEHLRQWAGCALTTLANLIGLNAIPKIRAK